MDNEKKILGKKRQGGKIILEQLETDNQNKEIINPESIMIKEESKIINKEGENLNIPVNYLKNNAQSLNEPKSTSAFVNKLEHTIPLNLNNNASSVFTFGRSMSFQNDKDSEQIVQPTLIPNPQSPIPNPQ